MATARKLYPDIERRGDAAVIFAVTGRLDAAWAATGAVGDPWDRIETLRTVGVRLAGAGAASRADAAFAQARQTAAGIGEMRPCALRKIAVSQAAAGKHADAETTLKDIPLTPLRDRQLALREIADAEAEGGAASAAYAWATAWPEGMDRAYALLGVAEGLLGPHRAPQNSPRHARRDEYRSVIMNRGCRY